jgi:hypothetical protein
MDGESNYDATLIEQNDPSKPFLRIQRAEGLDHRSRGQQPREKPK